MAKPPASNSSSADQSFPNPLLPDPKGTDHTPRILYKGKTIFPRTLWRLLHDGIVSGREFAALIVLIDQTDGWPVLNRSWVRLTNDQWAKHLVLSSVERERYVTLYSEKGFILAKERKVFRVSNRSAARD